ncbi:MULTISPECIES: glycosyltransferase [unclassified Novosphingobium]|uniref:glycosyltransferase n=1 Tax=unclassified Novosphingobium TaxID=2644732 RepID=UPI00146CF17F|nr:MULTISPECIES: glycosyltransferase [unclassified Novosphingobium]NMN03193.1 glycosyltransferase involved in cell wall biosynthesis [Novosphingobium sp. SG919]NMN86817.1 glycosyltransferase involved in cell wall biosynthesis [Novosphingobium sp. SG916]
MTDARFAIIVPHIHLAQARQTVLALRDQIYTNWTVHLPGATTAEVAEMARFLGHDRVVALSGNPLSITPAEGLYALPLLPGDELLPDALALLALHIGQAEQAPTLIYGDHIAAFGADAPTPFFKPAWSPEFLLGTNYIGRAAIRTDALARTRLPAAFDAVDLWGLWLDQRHLPNEAVARVERPIALLATPPRAALADLELRAAAMLKAHFAAMGIAAQARRPDWARRLGEMTFDFAFEDDGPKVSLLIPSKNNWRVLKRCVDSLALTAYRNFEAIVIDNKSDQPDTVAYIDSLIASPPAHVKVISIASPSTGFSYSYINNEAAKHADGEFLLFLNDDTEVIRPDWLSQMVGWARVPGIASVGARLYFPDDIVQHNGLVNQLLDKVLPAPAFKLTRRQSIGPHGQDITVRNYSAVTAACMLTPRRLFTETGGFNDENYSVAYNDCDYGFRLSQTGWRHVCVPTVELYHYEGSSRGRGRGNDKIFEEVSFVRQYGQWTDPLYNANLSKDHFTFTPARRVNLGQAERQARFAVGLFAHNLNYEGAPLVLLDIARGLVEEMTQVVVFSLVDGPLRERFEEAGCRVVVQTDVGVFGTRSEVELESELSRIVDALHGSGVDVVLANTIVAHWGMKAAEMAGIPGIWLIHESEPPFHHLREHGEHHVAIGRRCFANAYLNVFVCDATRQLYEPLATKGNVEVIYNGFDRRGADVQMARYDRVAERAWLGISPEHLLFLLPGTVCERKAQKDLVQAVARLPADVAAHCRFVIAGDRDGEYSREMHRLIDGLPAGRRETITVIKETPEIWRYYAAADALAFTSRLESFPRVIQEAMHRGLAIVSTPVFGISEQVRDGQSGLLYAPGDIDGLVNAIARVAREPDLRDRIAAMGHLSLDRFPTIEQMQASYAHILREAYLTGHDRPAIGSGTAWLSQGPADHVGWWNGFPTAARSPNA